MPTFTSLPLDIQQHIISYLIPIRDVAALSIQNKSLHRLCDMEMRRMYHSVKIKGTRGSVDTAFDLLMDILRRPALGHYIRHIEVRAQEPRHVQYTEQKPQRELDENDVHLLRAAIRTAGFADQENRVLNMLLRRISHNSTRWGSTTPDLVFIPQALSALIVSVSPFLESMSMTPMGQYYDASPGIAPWPKGHYPLDELLRSVNSNPGKHFPYLQNLRDVYIINNPDDTYQDDRFYTPMDFFTPISTICNLPSIESVGTDVLEEDEGGLPGLEPQSSDISRIAVHHSSISSSYFVSLICSCKRLRDLGYSVGGRSTIDTGYPHFNPKPVIRALLYHTNTLEILDLDVDSYIHHFDPQFDEADAIQDFDSNEHMDYEETGRNVLPTIRQQKGSLRDFSALKHLSVGVGFLFYFAKGIDVDTESDSEREFRLIDHIPPNLEYLCIRGYKKGESPGRDPVIEELVEAIRSGRLELEVAGVEEPIPNAENVDDPDGEPHLLWMPGKRDSSGETDEEEEEEDDDDDDGGEDESDLDEENGDD
ncbi:hypothetical protein BJX63DRAFT_398001 [Aspergillus granulosus]|uniref:F-box domain-containing protein n=1 Tax=Aspergillus granulosus TaxID=176169 RepID=A0ABR4H8X2_9EURO